MKLLNVINVLLVDDEALARSRLRTLLGDCAAPSASVGAEAADAVQAMSAMRRQAFDVVLLDIHMPGTDGMALASSIAALPSPPAVVFVTAHAGHAVQAFELEAADYLTKPVRLERLQQAPPRRPGAPAESAAGTGAAPRRWSV